MSALGQVLALHGGEWTWNGKDRDTEPIVCGCGEWRGCIADHREHVAAAILAHLRAVAADEGVRGLVRKAIRRSDTLRAGTPEDYALAAFLGALTADEDRPKVTTPETGVQRGTEAHRAPEETP